MYSGIDTLPIYNWWKIHSAEDYSYLLKDRRPGKYPLVQQEALNSFWVRVYDEYIKEFGFGRDFLDILRKRQQIARLKLQFIQTEDFSFKTFIAIEEQELAEMLNVAGEASFYQVKARMERVLKYTIDPHRMSVSEFFHTVKDLQNKPEPVAA